jgi:hypothetical protein
VRVCLQAKQVVARMNEPRSTRGLLIGKPGMYWKSDEPFNLYPNNQACSIRPGVKANAPAIRIPPK